MSTESEGPTRVRASDGEREEYAQVVQDAVSEGRLSLEEGEERLAKVYAAKFRDELGPFIADLPNAKAASGPQGRPHWHGGAGGYRGAGGPGAGQGEGPPWRWRRRGLAGHGLKVLVIAAILVTIWALTGAHFFWPAIPLTILAFGLFRHGFGWRYRHWYGGPGDGPTRV
jgi:hypothetical protein